MSDLISSLVSFKSITTDSPSSLPIKLIEEFFNELINLSTSLLTSLQWILMVNSSFSYPTEKSLIIQTEKLYDLKLLLESTTDSGRYRINFGDIIHIDLNVFVW